MSVTMIKPVHAFSWVLFVCCWMYLLSLFFVAGCLTISLVHAFCPLGLAYSLLVLVLFHPFIPDTPLQTLSLVV